MVGDYVGFFYIKQQPQEFRIEAEARGNSINN